MGVGCRLEHLRPRGHCPVDAYVSQTGTSDASAANEFSRRNGLKLKLYDAREGVDRLSRIKFAAAVVAVCKAAVDMVTAGLRTRMISAHTMGQHTRSARIQRKRRMQ